jgi:DNA-binding response OmpR family regulator
MKQIIVILKEQHTEPWTAWIDALSQAGFKVEKADPAIIESQPPVALDGSLVLLDGMLPQLSTHILRLRSLCPDLQIIVATAISSFTIYYEVMHLGGATYLPGPMPAGRFAELVQQRAGLVA